MMLRQSRWPARALAAVLVAALGAGCGIKGPLVPAAKADATKAAAKDGEASPPKKP